MRPLRPFAGMTRIRFKGFGVSPSQPRSGTPLEQAEYLGPTASDVKFNPRNGNFSLLIQLAEPTTQATDGGRRRRAPSGLRSKPMWRHSLRRLRQGPARRAGHASMGEHDGHSATP